MTTGREIPASPGPTLRAMELDPRWPVAVAARPAAPAPITDHRAPHLGRPSTLVRRLAVLAASLAIVAAAVPASALAWVGPAPAVAAPVAPVGRSAGPVQGGATVRAAGGQVIYDTPSSRTSAPSGPAHGISAALAARAAAAAAAKAAAVSEPVTPAPKPAAPKPASTVPRPTASAPAATYAGRDYMWFPALGIRHSVTWYSCSASYALSYSAVYRWGCGGTDNVYLMAHAGGVFGPLYTAYYAGRLKTGMLVVYADGNGRIHYFKLQWWRTTPPDGDVGWAYASQPVSSLTLQTCVGADSSLRLVVRFVEVSTP